LDALTEGSLSQVDGRAAASRADLEKAWWLRTLAVFHSPRPIFAALRDDSEEGAHARQEPALALALLSGIAGILSTPAVEELLDRADFDGVLVSVFVFLAGSLYGLATYWIGGGALYFGARAAGGASSYRQARHTLAFAAAPLALLLLLVWPVRLAVYGGDVFRAGGADQAGVGRWLFAGTELAFFAWAGALLVLGVSALHAWPFIRSAGAVILAILALLLLGLAFSIV
jgi:hypothetical protein